MKQIKPSIRKNSLFEILFILMKRTFVRLEQSKLFALFIVSSSILLSPQTSDARYSVGTGYGSLGLNSDIVENISISGLTVNANYNVAPKAFSNFDVIVGLDSMFANASWQSGFYEKIGYLNEIALHIGLDYDQKSYLLYGGLSIPVYSQLLMAGSVTTATDQGLFESASESTYQGSGMSFVGGGEYPVGQIKIASLGFQTSVGLELGYVSRTFSIGETAVVSTFSDFAGTHAYDLAMSGTSVKFVIKLRGK
jgi:hypothetical protein